jgi:hypothetical protein
MMTTTEEMKQTMIARIENNFVYHAPKNDQLARYQLIRDTAKKFALLLIDNTPASREQSLALTQIEDAVMWGNASIARNE